MRIEQEVLRLVQNAGSRLQPAEYIELIERVRAVLAVEASRTDEPEPDLDPDAFHYDDRDYDLYPKKP